MKKFWLLTTLLVAGLLLTGCNKTVENPEIIENDCSTDGSCLVEVDEPTVEESENNAQIPSFEELEDVVATCHVEDMGGYDYDVLKNQYVLPYKDWYIWYGFGWNWWAWGYYLKYSSLDNPCEVIATTDEFFIWHADYFNEVEEFNNYEYPDDKLYVAQGWWSWIPIDTVAKELNCVAWKDRMEDDTCKKEVDRYMYNLIIWSEQNEVFTKWMNKFKNDIDNGNYTNRKVRNENRNTCNSKNSWESLMEEYWEDNRNLSEEKRREYRKIQINRIHECLESLNLGLIER